MTLAEYSARWLRQLVHTHSPRTVRGYTNDLRHHVLPPLGALELSALTRPTVRAWLLAMQGTAAPPSIRRRLAVLRSCLQSAVDDDLIPDHAAHRLGRTLARRIRHEPCCATPDEIRQLEAGATGWLHHVLRLVARTGLRRGEVLGLRVEDVHPGSLLIVRARLEDGCDVPKSGQARRVDLSPEAQRSADWLVAHAQGGWLVTHTGLAPLSPASLNVILIHLVRRLGLRRALHLHALRHAYATQLLDAGVPMPYVQRQLGHASITLTVDLYGRHGVVAHPEHVAQLDRLYHPVASSRKNPLRIVPLRRDGRGRLGRGT